MEEQADLAGALASEVQAGGLLAPRRPVLILLSGGRDSTCLLHLAAAITGISDVTALHINYGLRESAKGDELHCRSLCRTLGVALEIRHPGPRARGNLQAWARAVRYEAARALAGPDQDIAAGHTATDQVETILYRLASSPSRRALLGMAPREGQLVRPLLAHTREQTTAYCTARGLTWREDETNASAAFARARVREVLVPALRSIHPAAERNVLAVASLLREEAAVLDDLVAGVVAGSDEIELGELRRLPRALARLVVQRLADSAARGPAAGVARRTDELLAVADRGTVCLDVGARLRAVCRDGRLHFEPLPVSDDERPGTAPAPGPS